MYNNVLTGFLVTHQVCYNEYGIGCFSRDFPYDNAGGFLPESPDDIQIRFILYTRTSSHSPQIVAKDAISINQSYFQGNRRTIFVIHGYMSNANNQWMSDVALGLLRKEDANVFVVDWAKGAHKLNYAHAAANTRVTAALLAQFIEALHDNGGLHYPDVYMVGHSLGAHVAGYVGERIQDIGRITGLDPAGPLFENGDPRTRLDPTDATFVDAIHTDGDALSDLGFGLETPVGDFDFYPNGGMDQPGCPNQTSGKIVNIIATGLGGLTEGVACSHQRSVNLYIASLDTPCSFTAYPCQSLVDYTAGRCTSCGSGCAIMGYGAQTGSSIHGVYYLTTSSTTPYCQN
ncbi:pancreatic triacylglycerol lipase-like [Mya arenaria]|uniref:pancreatic triacylglycerol lipase-like n=1 Tax=Mya arenaria TaxID=6604 RepID=UPI0022E2C1BC|nr:pancreatic triacylglycerol lipase-like [Mya arenaria]